MEIMLKDVSSKKELKEFIYLPEKIHEGHETWVPPLYMDEWKYFSPQKNRSHTYSDTILLLARKEGKTVGRIMGIINNRYNEQRREKTARFCLLEAYNDKDVVKALLERVEDWAREIRTFSDYFGIGHVALGTDSGGGLPTYIDGWQDITSLNLLKEAMLAEGFEKGEMAAFMGGNVLRVLHRCFVVSRILKRKQKADQGF